MQSSRLFVYGSLRVGFRDPAYAYLSKYFHYLGEGKVNGKFYFNGTTPVALPEAEKAYIQGDVYEMNNPEEFKWIMIQLDDYEGLNVEPGNNPLYRRELVSVQFKDEDTKAWIYWFNGSKDNMTELDTEQVASYFRKP